MTKSPVNVLLIEDNPGDTRLIREALSAGMDVPFDLVCADRLSRGLKHLASGGTDVLLLDLSLPDSWGLDTLASAKHQAPEVPIVVLTSLDDETLAVKAIEVGAQDYLVKDDVDGDMLVHSLRYSIERKRAEEDHQHQLEAHHQREKLAALGQLMGGMAHHLNNPLMIVIGQAFLIRQTVSDSSVRGRADEITEAGERCARFVKEFIALEHPYQSEWTKVQLNEVVRKAVGNFVFRLRIDHVEVALDLAVNLPLMWADPLQLHQVVVSLIQNAHQAMRETPPPRQLTLTTRVDPDQGTMVLEVKDTGPGIPAEIRSRIFEPFFTTKPVGQGTGLALSLCHAFVEGHGGTIQLVNSPGPGAVFRIELPLKRRSL